MKKKVPKGPERSPGSPRDSISFTHMKPYISLLQVIYDKLDTIVYHTNIHPLPFLPIIFKISTKKGQKVKKSRGVKTKSLNTNFLKKFHRIFSIFWDLKYLGFFNYFLVRFWIFLQFFRKLNKIYKIK